ncbi:uncharacterized protein K452DRAFT_313324 [Aplosporella prunicola CBS 121167]|uniref:Uncharacterized protein n=1 Tax=Aplosporella prunicola CBS 121167 TaxID=1176127 RepID=A0A6A6AZB7_9PEZI|nr:uncharacterized protein K452DRAFT_313324 [Aplosporella prunicola CBS 121167]KAF2136295.1 hypothetical protein K452DRAFT_313324 [Aplosporella prunicola CBS 121167]
MDQITLAHRSRPVEAPPQTLGAVERFSNIAELFDEVMLHILSSEHYGPQHQMPTAVAWEHHAPMHEVATVVACMRVCKAWKANIKRSPRVSRLLFLTPEQESTLTFWEPGDIEPGSIPAYYRAPPLIKTVFVDPTTGQHREIHSQHLKLNPLLDALLPMTTLVPFWFNVWRSNPDTLELDLIDLFEPHADHTIARCNVSGVIPMHTPSPESILTQVTFGSVIPRDVLIAPRNADIQDMFVVQPPVLEMRINAGFKCAGTIKSKAGVRFAHLLRWMHAYEGLVVAGAWHVDRIDVDDDFVKGSPWFPLRMHHETMARVMDSEEAKTILECI